MNHACCRRMTAEFNAVFMVHRHDFFLEQLFRLSDGIACRDSRIAAQHTMQLSISWRPSLRICSCRQHDTRNPQSVGQVRYTGVIADDQAGTTDDRSQCAQAGAACQIQSRLEPRRDASSQLGFTFCSGQHNTQAATGEMTSDLAKVFQWPAPRRCTCTNVHADVSSWLQVTWRGSRLKRKAVCRIKRELKLGSF